MDFAACTAEAGWIDALAAVAQRGARRADAIADAAIELFIAHGFDAVTIADIAHAAGVSRKTIFNYFPAKEDLVFHEGHERRAALLRAIRSRPPGEPLTAPFRRATMDYLDRVEHGSVDAILAVPRIVAGSRALHSRLAVGWERESAELAPAIAEQAGEPATSVVAMVVARTLAWTHRLTFRAAFTRLLAGEDQRAVAADLREQATRAYDLLETGLAGYGHRQPAGS
ncbi:MAG: TetR family transcriptional regulator [Solirubrobacteraceae bacterium]